MKKKVLFALPLLLVMMVSVSGVAYAMWCDSVTFAGEVNTADFCAIITQVTNTDPGAPNGDVYSVTLDKMADPEDCSDWIPDQLDKNVGWATAAIDPANASRVDFAIYNGYPGYYVGFGVDITNCGTIPWNVTSVDFYYSNGTYIGTLTQLAIIGIDFNDDGCYDIKIRWNDNFGLQVHEPFAAEISWNIKIMECAPQCGYFDFYAVINICAFNAITPDLPPPVFD